MFNSRPTKGLKRVESRLSGLPRRANLADGEKVANEGLVLPLHTFQLGPQRSLD